ncbi:hypothetical protein [Burkholderia arboris]|uniref:hypothetical protein n=1 Tax=Burkholderia arboris TaxID=488730 RepID=UPI001C2E939F|nr:hypothetical protein [Burkholderia arboris]
MHRSTTISPIDLHDERIRRLVADAPITIARAVCNVTVPRTAIAAIRFPLQRRSFCIAVAAGRPEIDSHAKYLRSPPSHARPAPNPPETGFPPCTQVVHRCIRV